MSLNKSRFIINLWFFGGYCSIIINAWMNITDWLIEWMNGWTSDLMKELTNEWIWINEWINERLNKPMNEWTNERTNKQINERINEWNHEWIRITATPFSCPLNKTSTVSTVTNTGVYWYSRLAQCYTQECRDSLVVTVYKLAPVALPLADHARNICFVCWLRASTRRQWVWVEYREIRKCCVSFARRAGYGESYTHLGQLRIETKLASTICPNISRCPQSIAWLTGWINWYSVGLEIQRPEVRIPSGTQGKIVRVFSSQNIVLTRCRCAQPPCV